MIITMSGCVSVWKTTLTSTQPSSYRLLSKYTFFFFCFIHHIQTVIWNHLLIWKLFPFFKLEWRRLPVTLQEVKHQTMKSRYMTGFKCKTSTPLFFFICIIICYLSRTVLKLVSSSFFPSIIPPFIHLFSPICVGLGRREGRHVNKLSPASSCSSGDILAFPG